MGRYVAGVQRGNQREIDVNEKAAGVKVLGNAVVAAGVRPALRRAATAARTTADVTKALTVTRPCKLDTLHPGCESARGFSKVAT